MEWVDCKRSFQKIKNVSENVQKYVQPSAHWTSSQWSLCWNQLQSYADMRGGGGGGGGGEVL